MSTQTPFSRIVFSLLIALLFSLPARAQDPAARFDEYLGDLARKDLFSGAVLVARDGKVLFAKGYGKANEEFDIPNAPAVKFRLGSITKQFTAAAILQLEERGKLRVADPICNYLKECPETWKEITIRHLLTHTSGIPNYTALPSYPQSMHAPVTNDGMIARFKDRPLDFKPSEKWNYSNSGYFLLGVIIEKVSGEGYEAYLQKNIFTPLGMKDSGYDWHHTILKNRATGYSYQKGARVNSTYLDMGQPAAAGSLYSTVEDLFRWNEALFNGKALSPKSFEAMTTPVLNNYGYGVGMTEVFKRKTVSHGGGINGFNTYLIRYLDDKVTIAVLRNRDYGAPSPTKICETLAALYFGEKIETPAAAPAPATVKVDPKIYNEYAGEYQLAPTFVISITREGDRLMAQATGQPQIELFPESETKFFLKVVEAKVTFVRGADGKVTHLILHQGGDQQAKKVK